MKKYYPIKQTKRSSLNNHSKFILFLMMVVMFFPLQKTIAQGTNCGNATSITIGSCAINDNIGDTNQSLPNIGSCTGTFNREGWYTFTVTGGPLNITITGTTTDRNLFLQLISQTGACTGLAQIACANDISGNSAQFESINATLNNGIYYIKVVNVGSNGDMFLSSLCVTQVNNDVCAGAIGLTSNTSCTTTTGSTIGATDNNETGDCTNGTENAVWYQFTAVANTHIINVDGIPGFDPVIGAISTCGSTTIPTGGGCVNATGNGGIETMTLTGLTIGQSYKVQVYDSNGDQTANAFTICVTHVAPTISNFTPNNGCANSTTVIITGTNFTGATAVRFGGTNAASFTVNSATQITATVAAGTSGAITVTTPGGIATSPSNFTVNANVGTPTAITIAGGTEPSCQLSNGTTTTTYATTATNNTGLNWSLSNPAAGSINSSGVMTWSNGFSGTVNIQVTANGCNGPSAQVVRTVTINTLPTAFNVTGTGSYCSGGSGLAVGIDGSTLGVNYQLFNGVTPIGASIAGTGSAISFGTQTGTTTYTVIATNTTTSCVKTMTGSATVTVIPTVGVPTTITIASGTEPTCQLTNSTTTTTYATTASNSTSFNWSLSNPSAGSIDATTGVMTWANGFSGTVDIQVTANGCNGPSSQVIRTVIIIPTVGVPTSITIAGGTEPTCQLSNGTTTTTYATTASNNTGLNWSLSNPAAGSINSSGVMTWSNGFSGTVTIQVTANGCNGPTSPAVIRTIIVTPNNTAGVASSTPTLCINTALTAITHATTTATGIANDGVSGANGLPAGVSATWALDTITISGTPTVSGIFNYSIPLTGGCGSINATGTITVEDLVVAAGTISGSATVCQGQNNVAYSVPAITNATSYSWTLPYGASIATGNNTNFITVNYSTIALSGDISVSGTNTCGNGTVSANYSIIVNPLPDVASTIIGTSTVCQGQSGVIYSVPSIANATGYIWSLPSGASIVSGANTNSIIVDFSASATSGNITVRGTNACGTGIVSANYPITVNPLPVAAGTISGSATVCQGQNGVTYSVPAIANASGYVWTLPSGATIASGNNTNAITVDFNTSAVSGNITVLGTNACGNGIISANFPVTINPLPIAAGNITGSATVCQGQNSVIYSVPAITYATGYTWVLPSGATITAGSNTNTITVAFSTTAVSGNITVLGTNGCGNGIVSANFPVTVNPLPANAGTISGPAIVCQGDIGVVYSVPVIANALNYIWTLPTGATITSGNNTETITVNYSLAATSGIVTVKGNNACGDGILSANYTVTVNITPSITLNYSPTVCSGELVTISPANGGGNIVPPGTSYSWGLPTVTGGITGATALSGQSNFNQTLTNPTNTTQTASYNVTASTGGCSATTFSVLVTVYPRPTVSGSPLTQSLCSGGAIGTPITFSNPNGIAGTIDYNWTRNNTGVVTGMAPSGSGASITGNLSNTTNNPQTTVFSMIATTQNGCNSLPFSVNVVVNPIPTVLATPATNQTICSEGNITPITISNPNGVTGTTYSWTRTNTTNITGIPDGIGATISGSLTNTTNIVQTTIFTIKATANGCDSSTTTVSITVNPKPTVAVGTASQTVCGGTAIAPVSITNPNSVAGTTYSWNRDNTTNLSGMLSGVGTPISGTLVNNTNSNQTTNFTVTATAGTCFSTTNTTVIVRPTPTILVSPSSQTICTGLAITPMNITNPNNVTGTTYTWTRDNLTNLTGIAASGSGSSITGTLTNNSTATQTTTFTIIATAANGCSSSLTATVTVYAPLVAPVISAAQTVCVFSTPATLTSTLPTGGSGTYTYQWQSSPNASGGPWTNVGTNSLSYSPPFIVSSANDLYYQLVVTNLCGSVTSNTVWVEVITNIGFTFNVSNIPSGILCPNSSFTPNISAIHLPTSYVRYIWIANSAYITPSTGGPVGTTSFGIISSASIGSLTTINNTNATVVTPITITPNVYNSSNNNFICSASPTVLNVSIYPRPTATATVPSATICSGTNAGIVIRGNITDATTTLTWTRSANANLISTLGSGSNTPVAFAGTYTIPDVLTNTSLTSQTVTYTITPSSNGCSGTPITVTITVAPAVNPGTIATNQTICSGGNPVAFTQTAATGAGTISYQWQSSTTGPAGPYSPISGATSPTYTPIGVTVNTWYIRTATSLSSGATPPVVTGVTYTTNSASCSQNTTPISVTINTINPGSIAGTQTICSGGDPIAFTSVAATGAGIITYQWESSTIDCNSGFSDITVNGTSATYDIPSGLTVTTYFRRKAISTLTIACFDYSNCVTVFVNNVTAGTVGSDQTICGNNPDAFSVITPATGSGTLSYQWESNTTGCGGTWNAISGAIGATYDPPPGLTVTTYYRRITTSTLNGIPCTAIGNCITVTANSVTAGVISGNRTVCSGGDPAAFTETTAATGIGLTYQWQYSLTSGAGPWTDISGATSATYDAPGPITQNTFYQRVVKATVNGTDCFAISNFITVFVNNVTPSTVAGNQSLCSNLDPAAFTVTTAATGSGTVSYQWQSNTTGCGGSWADISGATSATYNPPAVTQTTYFQVRVTSTLNGQSCSTTSNCIEVTSFGKIWNGAVNSDWSNAANWTPTGVPDATHCVTIPNVTNDPEINSNAFAYSVSILNGGDLEIEPNNSLTVTDVISVNAGGLFTIENNGSLIQINNVVNTGTITYTRTAQQKRLDYVYWSSPVENFNINSHPSNGYKYSWNTTFSNANGTQGNWQTASGIMNAGQGYIVGGPSWFNNTANQNLQVTFTGIPRNGNISIPIYRGSNNSGSTYTLPSGAQVTTLDDNWNLLGNPYPSAISTRDFLTLNSSVLTGALYIWTHGNLPSTFIGNPFYDNFVSNYNPIDYIPFNLTGNLLSPNPDYYIGACQGFFVTMIDGPAASATVNFNNSLRNNTYGNSTGANFLRTQNTTTTENPEFNRIWLELNSSNQAVRTLVGYVSGATMEKDNLYDAISKKDNSLKLFSLTDEDKFIIQGRSLPFNDLDQVKMGVDIYESGQYSIALAMVDGLFLNTAQNIFLEDKLLNTIHNLRQAPYNFTATTGTYTERFVLRYNDTTLSNLTQEMDTTLAYITDDKLKIQSTEGIEEIAIYDISGKLFKTYTLDTISNHFEEEFPYANGVYIATIKLSNGIVVSKKLVH
ncbi:PKD-like domain-containing protein [Flavobacterium sp. RSB2_4_14]|uniref:PKD-like domain-containing protein n=1 Tax=Flavobacterium sp. RSB2_4_14 TaxID=3447665 RepID=UPI003F3C8ACC